MKIRDSKVPLVGPKGRKELLKRIDKLEAQVAQQDYIRIEIDDTSAMPDELKAEIRKHLQNGTIWDVLFYFPAGPHTSRVITATDSEFAKSICVYSPDAGEIIEIDVKE